MVVDELPRAALSHEHVRRAELRPGEQLAAHHVREVAEDVREHFGDKVLRTVIPRSVKVSEAPGYGMTILDYDPGSRGALSYLDASREIAERGAPPRAQ